MTTSTDPVSIGAGHRWAMLGVGVLAQTTSAITINGPAFLIPTLDRRPGINLAEAATITVAPTIGVMLTLVAWGLLVDRIGERRVLLIGLAGQSAATFAASRCDGEIALAATLGIAGAFAASTSSASGRIVVGWFPARQRGVAMGIRQMGTPLGVGIAAVSIAVIAHHHGVGTALLVPAVAALVALAAVAAVVLDPPRPARATTAERSPYSTDSYLLRIHLVSMLLVVPQFLVWTFALPWLIDDRGWSPAAAGTLVGASQLVGAAGRIAVGHLSDRVGSRTRPLRWVAVVGVATMLLLGLSAEYAGAAAVVLLVIATGVTVADNGLAFTAVAERAGPFWSGRALGIQNTGQFLTAAALAPIAGAAITAWGYPAAFALSAALPLLGVVTVPHDERPLS